MGKVEVILSHAVADVSIFPFLSHNTIQSMYMHYIAFEFERKFHLKMCVCNNNRFALMCNRGCDSDCWNTIKQTVRLNDLEEKRHKHKNRAMNPIARYPHWSIAALLMQTLGNKINGMRTGVYAFGVSFNRIETEGVFGIPKSNDL